MKLVEFSTGENIISAGEPGQACYWLLSGEAKRTFALEQQLPQGGTRVGEAPSITHESSPRPSMSKKISLDPTGPLDVLSCMGEEALLGLPYNSNVVAESSKVGEIGNEMSYVPDINC